MKPTMKFVMLSLKGQQHLRKYQQFYKGEAYGYSRKGTQLYVSLKVPHWLYSGFTDLIITHIKAVPLLKPNQINLPVRYTVCLGAGIGARWEPGLNLIQCDQCLYTRM